MLSRYPDPPQTLNRQWATALLRTLEERDRQVAARLPLAVPQYSKAALEALGMGAANAGALAWCTDASGGAQLAVWNGAAWVRVADLGAI